MAKFVQHDQAAPAETEPLPPEIAFLARHGVSPAALADAARRARRIGVDPAREVLVSGLIDEVGFYRALADELELTFHPGTLPLAPGGSHEALLREGAALALAPPGARFRFVLAPSGRALRRQLIQGPRRRADIAVLTPSAFAASLRDANGAALARRLCASDGASETSARTGTSRGQRRAFGLVTLLAAFAGLSAPLDVLFTLALAAGPVFLMLSYLRLAAVCAEAVPELGLGRRPRLDDGRLPTYTVVIALYREARVLPELLAALAALDYPASKLEILIAVEAGDHETRTALARSALPPNLTVAVVPPGEPRTKPRALNLALIEARGELLCVFDAEDVPDPGQLRRAAAGFLRAPPRLACQQARLVIDNPGDGFLQALFALEYAGLFSVVNPGLLRAGLPILLGGTSNHFRTAALREVGGWDAWNVTEDADMAVRLARAGFTIADLHSETWEEAPASLSEWLRQRARWNKGYLQTLVSQSRRPLTLLRQAGPTATLTFFALGCGGVVSALGYPIFAVAIAVALTQGWPFEAASPLGTVLAALSVFTAGAGAIAALLPPALACLRRGDVGLLCYLPALPFYYLLVSFGAWRGVYEYVAKRHVWNKTAHGLARTSARRGITNAAATPPRPLPAPVRY